MARSRTPRPSGRFLLRLDPDLHARLRASAREAGLSLNDYCARKLALPADAAALHDDAPGIVARAGDLYGSRLVGVVVFGSWARGEAGELSDVDLLVVLDRRVPLKRSLYEPWDEKPIAWDGRPVEVHLAHEPPAGELPSGLWAEVALDGLVLFERGGRVSARLGAMRRAIASGRLVRRVAQGQPYWVRVA